MPARNFRVELDDLITKRAVEAMLKRPADPAVLVPEAGVVQGLNEAKKLYDDILNENLKDDER